MYYELLRDEVNVIIKKGKNKKEYIKSKFITRRFTLCTFTTLPLFFRNQWNDDQTKTSARRSVACTPCEIYVNNVYLHVYSRRPSVAKISKSLHGRRETKCISRNKGGE